MPNPDLAQTAHQLVNDVFVWIGFGTVAGLLAKAIMPGRDPGGAVATLAIGIGGAVFGCGTLAYFLPEQRLSPLSPMGFVVAIAGAFVLLFFYRLLAGRVIRGEGDRIRQPFFRRRSYRRSEPVYEDRYDDRP